MLTLLSTLAPSPPDAGRCIVASRPRRQSVPIVVALSEGFRRLVTSPPYFLGFCRWDSRSDRIPPPDNHRSSFQVAPRPNRKSPSKEATMAVNKSKCSLHLTQ